MFWLFVTGGLVWLGVKIVGSQDYRNAVFQCNVARQRIRERKRKGIPTFGVEEVLSTFLAAEEERKAVVLKTRAFLWYLKYELEQRKKHLRRALCPRALFDAVPPKDTRGGRPTEPVQRSCTTDCTTDCTTECTTECTTDCNCLIDRCTEEENEGDKGDESDDEMTGPVASPAAVLLAAHAHTHREAAPAVSIAAVSAVSATTE